MRSFALPRRIYNEILAQAQAEAPRECCGLLGARARDAVRADSRYPLRNQAVDPTREYFAAPEDLFTAMRNMRKQGENLVAIYHSHPHGKAHPSPTDLALAFYPEAIYLIVALHPEIEMRGFSLRDGTIEELILLLID